jgi:hypothetical protein
MERATADLPPLDFPPPDTSVLPRSSYINEYGRRFTFNYSGSRGTTPATLPAPVPATNVTPTTREARTTPTTRSTPPTTGGSPPTTSSEPGP